MYLILGRDLVTSQGIKNFLLEAYVDCEVFEVRD